MLHKFIKILGGALLLLVFALCLAPAANVLAGTPTTVSGKVNIIQLNKKTLNIKKSDGTSVTLKVTAATKITRNGANRTLADIALRDNVTAIYDSVSRVATKVTVTGPVVGKATGRVTGVNKSTGVVTVQVGKTTKTFRTSANTKIARNGLIVSLFNLTLRDKVTLHTRVVPNAAPNQPASGTDDALDIVDDGPNEAEVAGSISAISGSDVTIAPSNGTAAVTVHVTATTMIDVDDQPKTLADLLVGMQAKAEYDPASFNAFEIEADSGGTADDGHVNGTVAAVDTTAGTITITPSDGSPALTLTVTAGTEVQVDGEDATLADVQVGMPVEAEYDETTLRASEIKAGSGTDDDNQDGDAEVEGTVKAVTASSITITDKDTNNDVTLTVDGSTEIKVNDQPATLADIQVGDKIQAEYYTATMVAKELKVEAEDD